MATRGDGDGRSQAAVPVFPELIEGRRYGRRDDVGGVDQREAIAKEATETRGGLEVEVEEAAEHGWREIFGVAIQIVGEGLLASEEIRNEAVDSGRAELALGREGARGATTRETGVEAVGAGVLVAPGSADRSASTAVSGAAGRVGGADGPGAAGGAVGAGGGTTAVGRLSSHSSASIAHLF
jgi:hypothetical protein